MAGNRDLNKKINTLDNMQKVMKAMNMIASVKLRKLAGRLAALIEFERQVEGITGELAAMGVVNPEHPFFAPPDKDRKVHVVLYTADRGLCGSHNSSVQKALDGFVAGLPSGTTGTELTCIGSRGINHARKRNHAVVLQSEIDAGNLDSRQMEEFGKTLTDRFLGGEIGEVCLLYNAYVSTIHQETVLVRILPFGGKGSPSGKSGSPDTGFRDSIETAVGMLVAYRMICALNHSRLSEQAARMTAMENASNNSQDLINKYVSVQNRQRQTSITNELIEIISGKEALKGSQK